MVSFGLRVSQCVYVLSLHHSSVPVPFFRVAIGLRRNRDGSVLRGDLVVPASQVRRVHRQVQRAAADQPPRRRRPSARSLGAEDARNDATRVRRRHRGDRRHGRYKTIRSRLIFV